MKSKMTDIKLQAKRLKSALLATAQVDLPLNRCQHLIAAVHGACNWQTLAATGTASPTSTPAVTGHAPGTELPGKFFHSFKDGFVHWQGEILYQARPGYFQVQLFSWLTGDSTDQFTVKHSDMADWYLYPDDDSMNESYRTGPASERKAPSSFDADVLLQAKSQTNETPWKAMDLKGEFSKMYAGVGAARASQ